MNPMKEDIYLSKCMHLPSPHNLQQQILAHPRKGIIDIRMNIFDHFSFLLQKSIYALLPWIAQRETCRTELSLKSYHSPLFFAQAVQWPPPRPPQWLLTAQSQYKGCQLQVISKSSLYLGAISISFSAACQLQEKMGALSMRQGLMSSISGKITLLSFFYFLYTPLFLNLFRWRMRILGALQISRTFLASLCSLQLEQYHQLPCSNSSSSERLMKQSLSSITVEYLSSFSKFDLVLRVKSSCSFRMPNQKEDCPSELNLASISHSLSLAFYSSYSKVIQSFIQNSSSKKYSILIQVFQIFLLYFRKSLKGRLVSMDLMQLARSYVAFPKNDFLILQAVGNKNFKIFLQISRPVVSDFSKKSGNLNQRLSYSTEE